MNTGTPESNYGYWYPGKENDGGAGGGFEPSSFTTSWLRKEQPRGSWFYGCEIDLGFGGALRTAATIVADDPVFGLFAYGGLLTKKRTMAEVIPKDGLRQRFHVLRGKERFHMALERDGFAEGHPIVFNSNLSKIQFTVENRTGDNHPSRLYLSGLPAGFYEVSMNGLMLSKIESPADEGTWIPLPVENEEENEVEIVKVRK
jgi:hypothetical protein